MDKKRPAKLSTTYVKDLKTPGLYGDGRGGFGLRLLVKPTANGRWSKSWSQRMRIKGNITTLGLGGFPLVTLAKAREKALDNARRVSEGEDIRTPKLKVPTLNQAFDQNVALRSPGWHGNTRKDTWARHQKYCKPIGSKPVSDITSADVLNLLTPLWHTKNQTARQLRSVLSTIMEWAITNGHCHHNPARSSITKTLGKGTPVVHQPSLEHADVGRNLTLIRDANTWWARKDCLLFIAFTCVRNREARGATWDEIDLDKNIWTIPATRMQKTRSMHRVPLSTQAIEILLHARAKGNSGCQDKIFPSIHGGKFMSKSTISDLMKKLEIPAVPHGFRSSFSNWAGDKPHIADPVSEMVLAHTPSDAVKKAYRTSDFFKARQPVMQEWADYLTKTMGPVISTLPEVSAKVSRQAQRKDRANQPVQTFQVDPIGEDEYNLILQNFESQDQEPQTQDIWPWNVPSQDTLDRAVDAAAIGLMRDGMLRPKETANVCWSDLKREPDGSGLLTITLSKKRKPGTDHVTYVSPRTMRALDETQRIRRKLRMDVKDDRILQTTDNALPKRIKKACHAAGLTGTFSGYSPRNGMEQDLTTSGVAVNDLKKAKGWRLTDSAGQSENESLARDGAVAQWYARKEPETQETPEGE